MKKRISVEERFYSPFDGKIMEFDEEEFFSYCIGELIIAIGKGEFQQRAKFLFSVASIRGAKDYHNSLFEKKD